MHTLLHILIVAALIAIVLAALGFKWVRTARQVFSVLAAALLLSTLVICTMGATRAPFYANGFTLLQTGTCISSADGTVSNNFPQAYGTVPNIVATQFGPTNSVSNLVVSVTLTNFVIKSGGPNISNAWVAVGSP